MKIKQKVVNNVTLPVGLSGKGNGIWDGIGISFGKIRHLRQEIWSGTLFWSGGNGKIRDHVGCDRDGLRNGFGIDEDRRFVRVAYFGGDGNGSFRRDDRRSFDRSFLSF